MIKINRKIILGLVLVILCGGAYYANALITNTGSGVIKVNSLQKGLVFHMPLDMESLQSANQFADKTPYENVGVSANTPTFTSDRKGVANRAMSFNGVDDYVDCGNDESINFGTGDFSFGGWVRPTLVDGSYHAILDRGSNNNNTRYRIIIDEGNKLQIFVGFTYIATTQIISENTWYHIMGVRDGDNLILYLNGEFNNSTSGVGGKIISPTDNLTLGQRSDQTNVISFNGDMADLRIYNRAISQEEVTLLYETYRPKLTTGSLQKGLVLDMPLVSKYTKSATTLTDRTPYSNDGTATGGATIGSEYTSFDGVDDYVNCGNDASVNFGASDFAFALDFKAISGSTGFLINKKDYALGNNGFDCYFTPTGNIMVRIGDTVTPNDVSQLTTATYDDGVWHSLVVNFDRDYVFKVYVDNVLAATSPSISSIPDVSSSQNLCIGDRDVVGHHYYYNGDIADVKLYNRLLSQEEITLLYEQGH